ncbi:L,D-transpeptidase [Cereibacter sphaeroides]|uniref:L,D-transpeptidase n=1 Tax=Cereibacter sphaeroides TaxID=1063 RepID=UPI00313E3C86
MASKTEPLWRRAFGLGTVATLLAAPGPALVSPHANISSFATRAWRKHIDHLCKNDILADLNSRAVHHRGSDGGTCRLYPTSILMREDLKRRGKTKIVRKRVGSDCTPTLSMIAENPDLRYMPPGPDHPVGTHAMYLSWPACLIHGAHDTHKIGRQSFSGCVWLYNEQVAEFFHHGRGRRRNEAVLKRSHADTHRRG